MERMNGLQFRRCWLENACKNLVSARHADFLPTRGACDARPARDSLKRGRDFRTFGHPVAAWLLGYNFGQSMLVLRRTCTPNRRDGARGLGGGARERAEAAAAAVAASFRCDSGTQVP